MYVSDFNNNNIRKITPAGQVTTFAGSVSGYLDGTGTAAQFARPMGIAFDSAGNLYVADRDNNRIRTISPSGEVTTFAGSSKGYADGPATSAQFSAPIDVTADLKSGMLYVSEYGILRSITLN